jgi:hypothetical protein
VENIKALIKDISLQVEIWQDFHFHQLFFPYFVRKPTKRPAFKIQSYYSTGRVLYHPTTVLGHWLHPIVPHKAIYKGRGPSREG